MNWFRQFETYVLVLLQAPPCKHLLLEHHLSSSFWKALIFLSSAFHPSCQNLSATSHCSHKPSCVSPPDIHWFNSGGSKPLPAATHLLTWADTPVHQQKDWWDATTHLRNCWQLLLQHAAQQQGPVLYHKVSRWICKYPQNGCWACATWLTGNSLSNRIRNLEDLLDLPSTYSQRRSGLCLQSLFLVKTLYWSFWYLPYNSIDLIFILNLPF